MALRAIREIALPFHFSPDGGVATVDNDADAAYQHIRTVILTQLRERVMRPDFGTDSLSFLFEPNDGLAQSDLATRISAAIRKWEPGISIKAVSPVPDAATPEGATFRVTFTLAPRTDPYTATVAIGGGLTNEVSL